VVPKLAVVAGSDTYFGNARNEAQVISVTRAVFIAGLAVVPRALAHDAEEAPACRALGPLEQ
jgi:hypothetical protein